MLKKALFNALENKKSVSFLPTQTLLTLVTLIAIANIIGSLWMQDTLFDPVFGIVEWIVTIVFLVEYLARIYVAKKKVNYIFSFWGLTDFLSILPAFLTLKSVNIVNGARLVKLLKPIRLVHSDKLAEIYNDTEKNK